jgi:hypothetical protein
MQAGAGEWEGSIMARRNGWVWITLASLWGAGAMAQPPPEAATAPPPAQEGRAPDQPQVRLDHTALVLTLEDGSEHRAELGCGGQGLLAHGSLVYVRCGEAGVAVVDVSDPRAPRMVGRVPSPGEVRSLFVRQDRVWMEVAHTEARPIGAVVPGDAGAVGTAGTPTVLAAAASGRATVPQGEVVEARPKAVVVSLGSDHGLALGDHVELFTVETVTVVGRPVTQERTAAIGVVEALAGDRAEVRLGFGERVPDGTRARPTTRPSTENLIAPPRQGGLYEIQAFVRPFVPLGRLGFGVLSDASLTYRGTRHWFLRVVMEPAGFGTGEEEVIGAFGAAMLAGYDHPYFGMGIGLGMMQVNRPVGDITTTQTGLALGQTVRFGAIDGLKLEVTNMLVLVETGSGTVTRDELRWGSALASLQIPIVPDGWIVTRAGGGRPGHIFFDAGLRWAVRGDGGPGSLFLVPSLGGVWLRRWDRTSGRSIQRAGPAVGLGVEWRP